MPSGQIVVPTVCRNAVTDRAVVLGSVSRTTRRAAQSIAARTTGYSSPHTSAAECFWLAFTCQG